MHKLGPSVMSARLANNKQACLGSIEIKFKITKLPTILERTVVRVSIVVDIVLA